MEVRKLNQDEKRQFPDMDFAVITKGDIRFYSRSAIFLLKSKIEKALKQ